MHYKLTEKALYRKRFWLWTVLIFLTYVISLPGKLETPMGQESIEKVL